MPNLKPYLVILALLATPLFVRSTPAQDAPVDEPAAAEDAKPVLLTEDEIKLWQAWIRGDLRGCYAQAQTMLEGDLVGAEFRIALALQTRAAEELGWHQAHAGDLQSLLEQRTGTYEADLVRWELIQVSKHLGQLDDIQEHVEELGFITDWWVCGPFGNERGQGFEDVLEPEKELSLDREYVGKDGQPVSFRKLPVKPVDGVVNLGAMMRPNEEAAAFLATAIWVGEADDGAVFLLGTGDESVVMRILSDAGSPAIPFDWIVGNFSDRDFGFDQGTSGVVTEGPKRGTVIYGGLRKGWNVVLAKSGQADRDWLFTLRLRSSVDWRVAETKQELQEALNQAEGTPEPRGGRGGRRLTSHAYYVEGANELLNPTKDRSSSAARIALENASMDNFQSPLEFGPVEGAILSYLKAWANRSTARYSSGREENRRRELLVECLELDPKAARAALELSQYYTTTFSNPTLAHDYARMAVELNPDWIEARLYNARVVQMKGLDVEVERELSQLLKDHPEDVGVLRFAAYYAGLRRDYEESNRLFAQALKADFADEYSRSRLMERAAARGDTKTAMKLASEQRRLNPFDTAAGVTLAEMFRNAGQYSLAERELKNALKIAPRDDEMLFQLGNVYKAWAVSADAEKAVELNDKALDAYTEALEANPNREDIERYLEYLEGTQPVFEELLQRDIEDQIETALEEPIDGDDPYYVVYRDEITVVNEDGTTSRYVHEAYRITNDNGREWLQRVSVPAYAGQQGRCVAARVWREDGDYEEGRRSRYSASFPPLNIGDVVEVRFRVADKEQSFFGDFYGAREAFEDYVPVREIRYTWVLPKGREFYTYTTGDAPEKVEQTINDHRVWSWTASNLEKLHNEPLAPPAHQLGSTVQISTYANWKDFGRWYYNLIRKQMEPTPEMTAEVNSLVAGLETEKEKATAIYNWVVTQVRYNADWHFGVHGYKPFSAGAVFARCIGDCKDKAILICTMLKIAGVKAYPVIIALESFRGAEDITLPMPAHFNHAIAYIEYSDGSGQFVDGTATYNGIDELSGADRGANVIIVRPDGGEKTRIPPGQPSEDTQTDEIDAEFVGNGTLKLKVKRTASGDSASILRARYENEGQRKKRIELEWSEFFPGAKVGEVKVGDLMNLNVSPTIEFTVELPNAYSSKERKIEFRAGLDPREWTQTDFAALSTRKTALLMPAPFERISITRFHLPDAYSVARKPNDLSIKHPNTTLGVSLTVKDDVLTVRREYTLGGDVLPAAGYSEFRRALVRFDTAESATISLKK